MVAENRKRNHIIHKYTHTAHFTINENIRVYYYLHFTFFFFAKNGWPDRGLPTKLFRLQLKQ